MTTVEGSPPPSWGAPRDPMRRTFWITFALATALALAVAILSIQAAQDERPAKIDVTATVLDGRGTSGEDAELLLRIPVPGSTGEAVERWVATEKFGEETVGSPIEVRLPGGEVDEARLVRDCTCEGALGGALPLLGMIAGPAVMMAMQGRQRRRSAHVLATAPDRRPVRLWWAERGDGSIALFDGHDQLVGSLTIPPSARVALPDGSAATLVGRPAPGSPVALETAVGPILALSSLRPLAFVDPAQVSGASLRALLFGSRGHPAAAAEGAPGHRRERRRTLRVPGPATARTGLAAGLYPLLLLGFAAPLVPAPWGAVCLGLAATTVAVQAATALDSHRRRKAATEVARAADAVAPPPPAPGPSTAPGATIGLAPEERRPLELPGRFLGFALTLAAVSFAWFFLVLLYWPLTALVLIDGLRLLVRSPRPVRGRIVRPALPMLAGTVIAIAGGWAWLAGISTEDWALPMVLRVPLVLVSIPLALLAWRMITVGVTVGEQCWDVRDIGRRTRIDAADVAAVRADEQRSGRHGGLEIDLVDGRTIRASSFAVSRRAARRFVDVLDAEGLPGGASSDTDHGAPTSSSGGPLISTAHGPFWRG